VPAEISFYELLGVDPNANLKEIKAAYYAAVKKYHPDIDPRPSAHDLMIVLTRAYRVLGDPDHRRAYDLWLGQRKEIIQRRGVREFGRPQPKREPQTSVLSRAKRGERAAGERRRFVDRGRAFVESIRFAQRLEAVGRAFDLRAALAGLSAGFRQAREAARIRLAAPSLVAASVASFARRLGRLRGPGRAVAAVSALMVAFAILTMGLVNGALTGLHRAAPAASSAPERPAAVAAAFRARPLRSPCFDERSGLRGDDLYRQCVRTRVKLHLLMMNSTSGAEIENLELEDAMAELRQAVGAAQINMTSTKAFIAESVATLADIKNSAKDGRVRRIAQNYYDCYARKHCGRPARPATDDFALY
jgi:curved DNA-binding protein CbpA